MSIQKFIAQSQQPKLSKAVIKQFGGAEPFRESYLDVTTHGIDSGYNGFIYYVDTVGFYKKNKPLIIERLSTLADDLGESKLKIISKFKGLKDYSVDEIGGSLYGVYNAEYDYIYNVLTWYAAEEICNEYANFLED